jgi:hypothetical protein
MIVCSIALTQRSFSDGDSDSVLSIEFENSVMIPKICASKKLITIRLVFAFGFEWLGFPSTSIVKIWIACFAYRKQMCQLVQEGIRNRVLAFDAIEASSSPAVLSISQAIRTGFDLIRLPRSLL